MRFAAVILIALLISRGSCFAEQLAIAEVSDDRPVSFQADVLPALRKNCVACHNAKDAQGDVNLESGEVILKSDYEGLVVAGKPEESRLFVVASHVDEPVMPPEDNDVAAVALTADQLGLLKAWIQRGAKFGPQDATSTPIAWSKVPSSVAPTYATDTTGDGRLSVVSFGNRIGVFGAKSPSMIASLKLQDAGETGGAPHRDFVQDVVVSHDARRIVSAGFRNVKIWELARPARVALPSMDGVVRSSLSHDGRMLAVLCENGEARVGRVGDTEWTWSGPTGLSREQLGGVSSLAVAANGSFVVLTSGVNVHVVAAAGDDRSTVQALPAIGTSVVVGADQSIHVGDQAGVVHRIGFADGDWRATQQSVFDKPVEFVAVDASGASLFVADAVGNAAWRPREAADFSKQVKLPTGARQAALATDDSAVWIGLTNGGLVTWERDSNEVVPVYDVDPAADDARVTAQWKASTGERLVGADDADLKRLEASHKAELENQSTIAADREKREKELPEAAKKRDEAKGVAEEATGKLDAAKAALAEAEMQRADLSEQVTRRTAEVTDLTKQVSENEESSELKDKLADATRRKADAEAALAKVPQKAALDQAVAAAEKASKAAGDALAAAAKAHADAEAALKLAGEAKARSDEYLAKLSADIEAAKKIHEESQKAQSDRVAQATELQNVRNASKPFGGALKALPGGGWFSLGSSGAWSVWSASGDWIGEVEHAGDDASIDAVSAGVVVTQQPDQSRSATVYGSVAWPLAREIGSPDGASPFADRVLCLDVDASMNVLATGGGVPTSSGEIHLWNIEDGQLIRSMPDAHADTVLTLQFSPDGAQLASGSADRLIKIWDVATGKLVLTLEGHTQHVTALGWSVDGRQITSASLDYDIRVWDLLTAKTQRKISLFTSEITDLAYVGRDARIAVVAGDQTFRVIRTDNGGQEVNASPGVGYLYSVSANRDGSQFTIGGSSGLPQLIEKSGKVLQKYAAVGEE